DVGVRHAGRDQVEYLAFAGAELGEQVLVVGRQRLGEKGHDPACDGRAEDRLAVADRGDGADDFAGVGTFHEVPAGAGAHRGEYGVVVVEHGEYQDTGTRMRGDDAPGGLDAVDAGHVQ